MDKPSPQSMDLPQAPKELKQWLLKSKCLHYYSKFVENGITIDLLSELDTNSLKELGVNKLGDRIRLEIAISQLKAQNLKKVVDINDLYDNLQLMNLTSPPSAGTINLANYSHKDALDPVSSESNLNSAMINLNNQSGNLTLTENKNPNKNITFILADGSLKKVNVTGCFNAQSIKRKVLRKLGLKQQDNSYDTYIHSSSDSISLLFDVELVTICYSPDRLEKYRIILCEKGLTPSDVAIEVSKKIMAKYDKFNKSPKNLNQYRMPDQALRQNPQVLPRMRQFFGQRPPSELISSNLAEYFPETGQKELQQTIRNSVRYSVRLSKRFNLPQMNSGSNLSVNKRQSTNTIKAASPSISSIETNRRRNPRASRTIGEMMVHNINAIDEAVHVPDNQSILSKPSLNSDSSPKPITNPRVSIATSFADTNENNRYSRIELLNVDSDTDDEYELGEEDDDDVIGDYSDENPFLDTVSEDGPKNWLQGALIGSGSFGTVFLGMNPLTGELMAVKQVVISDKNNQVQNSMIDALQHEMTLLKNLNHENIVRYLGSSTTEDYLNIFLEYVPGGSVQLMLLSYGPFEEPLIRNFIRQVLIGLSYLHGEDIIHRDIKGANILIDIKGTVKISDFGISKKITRNNNDEGESGEGKKASRRASLQGSVYWMAPEVVKQTAYNKKADIWSVGCLIVEMFTGKHPFPNFSQMQAIFKIGTHVSPGIPEWCTQEAADFLSKTFELEYDNRPDAVDLLGEAFLNPLIMSKN